MQVRVLLSQIRLRYGGIGRHAGYFESVFDFIRFFIKIMNSSAESSYFACHAGGRRFKSGSLCWDSPVARTPA